VAPEIAAHLSAWLKPETGATLRAAQAVRSPDHGSAWYVAADLEGPGLESADEIAVWLTNSIDPTAPGMVLSVGGMATGFSDAPDGATTDAMTSITDTGAQAAIGCVEAALAA
jgi:hypothetical protein